MKNEMYESRAADVPSFNDVTEHNRSIMGVPSNSVQFSSLPTPIRWIGYILFTAFAICSITFVVVYVLTR
ncbi:hypothetical protein [Paenibacillus taihuensis]|uniref:hypothetical protein n=1 Tax=Paenibacillus taihuensis TaxID=1156355 RepID=UPI001FE74076|nr:hypothetical protein [Paenibacillus taihuensis]